MLKKFAIVAAFALAVWAFCGAIVGIGRLFISLDATLVVHALGAPIGAAAFGWAYFRRFNYTGPLATAAIFVVAALALDFFVVALLIENSFDMFASVLGVWIPQVLIFASTWLTGTIATRISVASKTG